MAKDTFKIKFSPKPNQSGVVEVTVQPKFISRSGLELVDMGDREEFQRRDSAKFLKSMKAYFNDQEVCSFLMGASISANPEISFPFMVTGPGAFRVVFEGNGGETLEGIAEIKI